MAWFPTFKSIRQRLILSSTVWILLALVAGAFALNSTFRDYVESEFDERLMLFLDGMVGASELTDTGDVRFTRVLGDQRFREPYSGWYWQVSSIDVEDFRSRSLWDQALTPDLAQSVSEPRIVEAAGPDGQALRIVERDIRLPGSGAIYRYMVAGDTGDIRRDIAGFSKTVIIAFFILGAGLIATLVLQVGYGLQPLGGISRGIARVRSGELDRLNSDYPPEVMPLVDELNGLIDHNEVVIERARTHAGNLAHALKTPLSVLQNEADAHPDHQLADLVIQQTSAMRAHVDYHLARARAIGGQGISSHTAVDVALGELVTAMRRLYRDRGLTITCDGDPGLVFAGEKQDLMEMLGNLVDNACKWATGDVRITVRAATADALAAAGPRLTIAVSDDGPGVDPNDRDALLNRGHRLDETKPGSGLGLAIVRDIAELNGGTIHLEGAALGGLEARLNLPAVT